MAKNKTEQKLTRKACDIADDLMRFAQDQGHDMLHASVAFAIAAAACCRGGGKTEGETIGMMAHFTAGVYDE